MSLSPDKLGDHGQRYQIEAENYPKPGINVVGWCNSYKTAQAMRDGILLVPSCTAASIVDRQPQITIIES